MDSRIYDSFNYVSLYSESREKTCGLKYQQMFDPDKREKIFRPIVYPPKKACSFTHMPTVEKWEDSPCSLSASLLKKIKSVERPWCLWCMRKTPLSSVDTFLCVLRCDVKAKLLPDRHLIGERRPGPRRLFPPSQKSYFWPWALATIFHSHPWP